MEGKKEEEKVQEEEDAVVEKTPVVWFSSKVNGYSEEEEEDENEKEVSNLEEAAANDVIGSCRGVAVSPVIRSVVPRWLVLLRSSPSFPLHFLRSCVSQRHGPRFSKD